MEKKIICPACGMENASFDPKVGMYICPHCGHEWTDDPLRTDKQDEDLEIGTGD
jgi:hypothetical protein